MIFTVADHRHHLLPGTRPTALDQRRQKRAADPAPTTPLGDVHGILNSEAICAPAAIGSGVAVAGRAALATRLGLQAAAGGGEYGTELSTRRVIGTGRGPPSELLRLYPPCGPATAAQLILGQGAYCNRPGLMTPPHAA